MSIVGSAEARPADGLAVDFVVESDRAQLSQIIQRVGRTTADEHRQRLDPRRCRRRLKSDGATQGEDDHLRSSVELGTARGSATSRPSLQLARREALWAIKALRDEPLPLVAAASAREAQTVPEIHEPALTLRPMTDGDEVVEDYRHVGLTLRTHPVSFLREDLRRKRIVTCAEAMQARDGRWLQTAGLVLVRQMPGSAKGVLFATIEDETGIANLVIWPNLYEKQRRLHPVGRIRCAGPAWNPTSRNSRLL